MLFNKLRNRKIKDKKVMHKIKKRWVVVSSALLVALGGYAMTSHVALAHADANTNNGSVSQNQSKAPATNQSLVNNHTETQNSQDSSEASDQTTSTDQIDRRAGQLHSHILLNGVRNGLTQSQQSNNAGGTGMSSNNNENGLTNAQNELKRTLGISRSGLGAADNNHRPSSSDYGDISVEYEDVTDHNRTVNQGTTSDYGVKGQPFSDKTSYEKNAPKGYTYDHVIQDVNRFMVNPQNFIVGVKPVSNQPDNLPCYIEIRYVDSTDKDKQVGNQINDSDVQGKYYGLTTSNGHHYGILSQEANVPNGYVLDLDAKEQVSWNNRPYKTLKPWKTFTPKFEPGNLLVQIAVKPKGNTNNPNNVNNDVKTSVNYIYNNQSVGKGTVSGKPSDSIPSDSLQIPKGYKLSPNEQLPNFSQGSVNVLVVPVKNPQPAQEDTMFFNYYPGSSDDKPVNSQPVPVANGTDGTPFNPYNYTDMVPTGYQFVKFSGNVPSQFVHDGMVHMIVAPNVSPNPVKGTMYIDYQLSNGEPIQTKPISGIDGSHFDVNNYESQVPQGYQFTYAKNVPSDFVNGHHITFYLKNGDHKPKKSNNQPVKVPVYYYHNNKQIGEGTITGTTGSSITPSDINKSLPNGYQPYKNNAKLNPNVPQTFANQMKPIKINVVPVVRTGSIVLNYVDVNDNNQQVGSPYTFNGNVGNSLDLTNYEKDVPKGYEYDNQVFGNNVYTNGSHNVSIGVKKIPVVQYGSITLHYVDAKGNTIDNFVLNKKVGTPFNINDNLENAPQGYQIVKPLNGANINQFTNQDPSISIEVKPVNGDPSNGAQQGSDPSTPNNSNQNSSNPSIPYIPAASTGTSDPISNDQSNSNTPANSANSTVSHRGSKPVKKNRHHKNDDPSDPKSINSKGSKVMNDYSHRGADPVSNHNGHDESFNTNDDHYDGIQNDNSDPMTMHNGSLRGVKTNDESNHSESNSGNKLPQTGETMNNNDDIASILMALGSSLSALGYAIRKRRHDN